MLRLTHSGQSDSALQLKAAKSLLCLATDCKTMPSKPDLCLNGIVTHFYIFTCFRFKIRCKENHRIFYAVCSVPGGLTNSLNCLGSCLLPVFLTNFSFTFKIA